MAMQVNTNWIGKSLLDVIGKAQPTSVVVLKNDTQAPDYIHTEWVRLILLSNPQLLAMPVIDNLKGYIYFDCVVVMADGKKIRMERGHNGARLSTDTGQAYIGLSDEELLKTRKRLEMRANESPGVTGTNMPNSQH